MINSIINGLIGLIFDFFVTLMPDLNFTVPQAFFDNFKDILFLLRYFVPVNALLPIIIFNFSLDMFKLVMGIFSRVKSLIPSMGG